MSGSRGGLLKALKLVRSDHEHLGEHADCAATEWEAIQSIKEVRHPFILSTERVEVSDGRLLIVMELADRSLNEVQREYREQGLPGIPRAELLDYLFEAAEALDLMNFQHGLQHLDVKPHNLFVIANHVKVADFGLVNAVRERPGGALIPPQPRFVGTGLTPQYAAPELLQGTISPQCDQYSLAIVYQELLTGTLPFRGKNVRQLLYQTLQGEPDLSPLPENERVIVRRALARNPAERFRSCLDFVRSLWRGEILEDEAEERSVRSSRRDLSQPEAAGEQPPALATGDLAQHQFLDCLHRSPMGETWSVQAPTGARWCIHHLQGVALTDRAAQERAFRRLASLTDPTLVPFEVIESGPARIVLRTPHPPLTLRDRLVRTRPVDRSRPDREELLRLFLPFGQALDDLAALHGLYHLGLHPGVLYPQGDQLRVREFGWLQLLWMDSTEPLAHLNPRYAAPELLENRPGATSDQYSLALLYAELLTGRHPLRSGPRNGASPQPSELDLAALPATDRDIVARALSADPTRRYPSNDDFFGALLKVGQAGTMLQPSGAVTAIHPSETIASMASGPPSPLRASRTLIGQLVSDLLGTGEVQYAGGYRFLLRAGSMLEHQCSIVVPSGGMEAVIDTLRRSIRGEVLDRQVDSWTLLVKPTRSFWFGSWGKQPALHLRLTATEVTPGQHSRVQMKIRPVDVPTEREEEFLAQHGRALLPTVRAALNSLPEHRAEERVRWEQSVLVEPIWPSGGPSSEPLVARARDISCSGLGLLMSEEPATTRFRVTIPLLACSVTEEQQGHPCEMIATVRLARTRRLATGWFEVGLTFEWDT